MDLNNNPQEETFPVLVQEYTRKFKDMPISITVYDSNHTKYVISTCDDKSGNYPIISLIYNSHPEASSQSEQYLLTTEKELRDTLNFIYNNIDIFVTTATDDIYDNFEIVSLEEDEY